MTVFTTISFGADVFQQVFWISLGCASEPRNWIVRGVPDITKDSKKFSWYSDSNKWLYSSFLHSKAEFIIYHASLNHASFHFYMATSNSGKIHFHINIWPHFDSNYCAEIQKINLVLWILLQPQYCSGSIVCKHSLKGLWHNIRLVGEDNWTQFQTRLFLVTKICFKKG